MTTRWIKNSLELLTVSEMYQADLGAATFGLSGLELMERAGTAIADAVQHRWGLRPVAILCGPGNNGGDGFVAARALADRGCVVRLGLLGDTAALRGDAEVNARRWTGDVYPLMPDLLDGVEVVVDALFGAGLSREVDEPARRMVDEINKRKIACLAVDVPSGVHGDTGEVLGAAPQADVTVTFFRRKPGHLLYPGWGLCGDVRVADIGIPEDVLEEIDPANFSNGPQFWRDEFPMPSAHSHKYTRGHALVSGGRELTGAARLAAYAALRVGAGVVSIASHPDALAVYRSGRPSIMVHAAVDIQAFTDLLDDPRLGSVLVGPGNGVSEETRARVLHALHASAACVIDADAISVFANDPQVLFDAIQACESDVVLTPHEGEFGRLFDSTAVDCSAGRLTRAKAAAKLSGAVVILKGPDTVIAGPDGRGVINSNAPADLATAGSGDVLAGLVLGLLAQQMNALEASAAAVWLHGEAANRFGAGLIADDIADTLPQVLQALRTALSVDC